MTTKDKPPEPLASVHGWPENRGTYKCEQCGGTFDKGWSDEEANAALDRAMSIAKQLETMTCEHEWTAYWIERVCKRCGLYEPICNHSIDEPCDCGKRLS